MKCEFINARCEAAEAENRIPGGAGGGCTGGDAPAAVAGRPCGLRTAHCAFEARRQREPAFESAAAVIAGCTSWRSCIRAVLAYRPTGFGGVEFDVTAPAAVSGRTGP